MECRTATVYHVWRLRNEVIFQLKSATFDKLLKDIIEAGCFVASSWSSFPKTRQNWEIVLKWGVD